MKLKRYLWITILTIIALLVAILLARTQQHTASTISALAVGIFDGNTNFQQLRKHGNFGLGTVNALDGEMVGLDGKFYQIKADSVASVIPDSMTSPFVLLQSPFFNQKHLSKSCYSFSTEY